MTCAALRSPLHQFCTHMYPQLCSFLSSSLSFCVVHSRTQLVKVRRNREQMQSMRLGERIPSLSNTYRQTRRNHSFNYLRFESVNVVRIKQKMSVVWFWQSFFDSMHANTHMLLADCMEWTLPGLGIWFLLKMNETNGQGAALWHTYCSISIFNQLHMLCVLTCSIESDFILVCMFEQVLRVVEASSFKPLWNIWDPFGYIHNLVYTHKTHTGKTQHCDWQKNTHFKAF